MSTPPNRSSTRTFVITPRRGLFNIGFGELWQHRELTLFFVWRDLKVRYKQTIIGAAWAVIQPLMLMVVFSIVLGKAARFAPPPGVPRPIFYFSALLPWTYFAQALQVSTNSVLSAQSMIKKVYFPRLALPLAGVIPAMIDFFISFVILVVLMFAFHVPFALRMVAIAPLMVLAALTAFGAGMWLSALYALYRDVGQAVPFLIQILLFTSPVVLPAGRVPEWFRPIYGINPMVSVIEGVRWAVTGAGAFPWDILPSSIAFAALLLVTGVIFFNRIEDVIIDVV